MRDALSHAATRFPKDTADHQMTVLHDDGLYRHLRFRAPEHSAYWFDLVTIPGALIFQGDGESYVFRRTTDMFEFFRGSAYQGKPNVDYWQEKLTSSSAAIKSYDQDLLLAHLDNEVAEAVRENSDLTGLADDVRWHLKDYLTGDESLDRSAVEQFKHWINDADQYAIPAKTPDFCFSEIWEASFRDYDWWFLWACHAIVWGINQYDSGANAAPAPVLVDVQLPGGES